MNFPSPPNLKKLRARRCPCAEGIAWVSFVLLTLFFGVFMTVKASAGISSTAIPETEAGQLFFKNEGAEYTEALMLDNDVNITINGMIAKVSLTQRFENQTDNWQEAVYVFPLSETAAIHHMEMLIGDRIIIGEIKEKAEAKRIYTKAKKAGKKASLLEQQRPNLFTQKVANIGPGESIAVTIQYLQRVDYDAGEFSLRFPMTITPRYMPGAPLRANDEQTENAGERAEPLTFNPLGWAQATTEVPDAHEISPYMTTHSSGNLIGLELTLNAGLPLADINSLYHDVHISKHQNLHKIQFRENKVPMDRDFVLHWRFANNQQALAAVYKETIENEDYLLLMLLPPQAQKHQSYLARDMIFIIDTSGSMQGSSIQQAKISLIEALLRLRPEDKFNIIEFNSAYSSLYHQPLVADQNNVQKAIQWVNKLNADGGTEMHAALSAALMQMEENARLQQIVFITDGAVGNEAALFELLHNYLGNTRLFTVGIGSAPNSFFMRKAAEFGRGSFTHIAAPREVSTRMEALLNKLEKATVSHINIQWPMPVEQYPEKIPDLYQGEPILVAIKAASVQGDVVIDGFTAEQAWSKNLNLNIQHNSEGVASIWARSKINKIEDQKYRGMDASEVRLQVLDIALKHKLMSSYTSFVAVEQQISRPEHALLNKNAVPNLVAAGQVPLQQTLAYPTGATSAEFSFVLGFLSIVVWLIYCVIRRLV